MTREASPAERIAAHFRSQIEDGLLRPGAKLPTIREISETWSVARQTASNAVRMLVNEGLVSTEGRAGTVVSGPGRLSIAIALDGIEPASVRSLEATKATDIVATDLGILPGSAVLVVHFDAPGDA